MATKSFKLRTILSVTTGRLLTESPEPGNNGIGDMYKLLGWMTQDEPFTHQLGRFAEECKPWLYRWFPELSIGEAGLPKLDELLPKVRDQSDAAITIWIAHLKAMQPELKDAYDVPQIPRDDHVQKNAYDELVEMRGTDEGIIPVQIPSEETV